jgi:hypothetical protein
VGAGGGGRGAAAAPPPPRGGGGRNTNGALGGCEGVHAHGGQDVLVWVAKRGWGCILWENSRVGSPTWCVGIQAGRILPLLVLWGAHGASTRACRTLLTSPIAKSATSNIQHAVNTCSNKVSVHACMCVQMVTRRRRQLTLLLTLSTAHQTS